MVYRKDIQNMNKAVIESYLRNLFGQVVGAIMIVMQTSGIASPVDFGTSEWLLVANALWASLIPVILRWVNKKDPAFGAVAEAAAKEVTKKLSTAAASAKKPAAKKPAAKKAVAKKKPAAKKR
jgi:type IV secretory pathway TrbD component